MINTLHGDISRRNLIQVATIASTSLLLGSSNRNGIPMQTQISNTQNPLQVRIGSIYPIPHENIATFAFGIRKRATSIARLSELYSSGAIQAQKYELDCEIASTTHLLTVLGIINPISNRPYNSDDLIKLLYPSDDPRKGVHPEVTRIPKRSPSLDSDNSLYLPPDPYGIMPYPLFEMLNRDILNKDERHAYYKEQLANRFDYQRFIEACLSLRSPVVFWHCIDPNPEFINYKGYQYATGEHSGLIIGSGPNNIEYLDPYNMEIYYMNYDDAFESSKLVGGGLLTVI